MKQRRFELRSDPTRAEAMLWEKLKKRNLEGHRFRRQHGIGQYVVDWREKFIIDAGYKIIRFKNEEIYNDIDEVLKKILHSISEKS